MSKCKSRESVFVKVVFSCDDEFDEPVYFSVFKDAPLSEILLEARKLFNSTFPPTFRHVSDMFEFKSLSFL